MNEDCPFGLGPSCPGCAAERKAEKGLKYEFLGKKGEKKPMPDQNWIVVYLSKLSRTVCAAMVCASSKIDAVEEVQGWKSTEMVFGVTPVVSFGAELTRVQQEVVNEIGGVIMREDI